jgi:hypothetical protein
MAEQDGKTMAFMIAPFATQESRETVRKNANFVSLYFTICHGAEAGKAAARDISAVAERLGYRVSLTKSNLVPLARAEDIITAGQQVLPEPRREKRLETATQQRTEAGEVILRHEPPRHVPLPLVEEDDITFRAPPPS